MSQDIRRRIARSGLLVALLMLPIYAFFCQLATGPESALHRIKIQQAKWRSQGISSYRIQQQRQCFCPPPHGFVALQIVADQVVAAIEVANGQSVAEWQLDGFWTIDGLFDWLLEVVQNDPEQLDITFDPVYGYPTKVVYDQSRTAVDEEMTLLMRDLQAEAFAPLQLQCKNDAQVKIATEIPANLRTDPFDLRAATIRGDSLEISVGYAGGCVPHCFDLIMSPAVFAKSLPAQAELYVLHHNQDDLCEAAVSRLLAFDLRPIARFYEATFGRVDSLQLNLHTLIAGRASGPAPLVYQPQAPR